MLQLVAGATVILIVIIVALVVWLGRARTKQVQAETEATSLREGDKLAHEADKIMAEPVADELAWLKRTRDRLRELRS